MSPVPKWLFAATFAAILLGNLFAAYSIVSRQRASVEMLRGQQTVAKINEIEALLVDAETGQRGYLLTGEKTYLEPFARAESQVLPAIDDLQELLRGHQFDPALLPDLRNHAAVKLAELNHTVELFTAGDEAGARKIVREGHGKAEMDQVRGIIRKMRANQLHAVDVEQQRSERTLIWLYVTVFAFGVLTLFFLFYLVREVRKRSRLRARMEVVNELAHELNNPLQAATNLFTILDSNEANGARAEYLRMLHAQYDRLILLSRTILTRPKDVE